jgi:hypothetical protein
MAILWFDQTKAILSSRPTTAQRRAQAWSRLAVGHRAAARSGLGHAEHGAILGYRGTLISACHQTRYLRCSRPYAIGAPQSASSARNSRITGNTS